MSNPSWTFGLRGAASDETLEIDIYDDIGEDSWWGDTVSAKDVRAALKGSKASTILVRVNSRGGEVFEGMAIYNLLNEHPARVIAQVDALAASMASIVIMAADEIRIAQNAMIMIHNPWAFSMGEADDLRGVADLLDKMRDQSADIYVARTGASRERVLKMMADETWLTADEAKAEGFADVVLPAKKGSAQAKALASLRFDGLIAPPKALIAACARARGEISTTGPEPTQENGMDKEKRAKICAALGLSPDVSDDVIVQCAESLRASQGKAPEGFELTPKGELATMQARAIKAEEALSVHAKATREASIKACLDDAVKAGKVTPASRGKYEALCATDEGFATVKELIESLPASPIVGVQGSDKAPPAASGKRVALTAEEKAEAARIGVSEASYLAALNGEV